MRPGLRLSLPILPVIASLALGTAIAPALAAPTAATAAPALDSAATQQLIDTLKDPKRRDALIAALEALRKAAPAAAPPAVGNAAGPDADNAQPANAQTANAKTDGADAAKPAVALEPHSLGAQLIAHGSQLADTVSASLVLAMRGIADIPDLLLWLRGIVRDPDLLLQGAISAARLLGVILLALAGEFPVWRLTRRLYQSLAADAYRQDREARRKAAADSDGGPVKRAPGSLAAARAARRARLQDSWLLLRRLPILFMALMVDLLPPLAFLGIAMLLAATPLVQTEWVRTIVLAVVHAYVTVRIIGCAARATFGAPAARLRLLPASDDGARYLMVWVRRISVVIVFGVSISQLGLLFDMDIVIRQGVLHLVSLLVHIMLIVMVLQCRTTVAARLSGAGQGVLGSVRNRMASLWHIYTILFIAGTWIVYVGEIQDGFERLIYFVLATIAVGLVARITEIVLVGALDHAFSVARGGAFRSAHIEARAARYQLLSRLLLKLAIRVVAIITLFEVWGVDALGWFTSGALGSQLASSVTTLVLTLGVAFVLWEAINVAMQVYLDELSQQGAVIRAARLRTIVPLLRNTLLIILMILIALTALSVLGVNIGPLLAGASIFGVALGFGSQKLVQDFITGIFLLLENAMQVGDTVTAGGLSGTVENLSIRTLRLRAGDGAIHIIPFSSVSTVTNSNRGLGNATVSVTIDYEEDSDRVGTVLTGIVAAMRDDQEFANGILSDLQLWGIDRVDGATVTLAGQIVCTDKARWAVQREFNRRVKLAFQAQGIRMLPTVSLTGFHHPLDIRLERPAVARHDTA